MIVDTAARGTFTVPSTSDVTTIVSALIRMSPLMRSPFARNTWSAATQPMATSKTNRHTTTRMVPPSYVQLLLTSHDTDSTSIPARSMPSAVNRTRKYDGPTDSRCVFRSATFLPLADTRHCCASTSHAKARSCHRPGCRLPPPLNAPFGVFFQRAEQSENRPIRQRRIDHVVRDLHHLRRYCCARRAAHFGDLRG